MWLSYQCETWLQPSIIHLFIGSTPVYVKSSFKTVNEYSRDKQISYLSIVFIFVISLIISSQNIIFQS